MSYSKETCDENEQYDFDIHVFGETIVKEFKDHVRIKLDDWNEIKQLVIPALKQGDKKHETRSSKENERSQHACG